MISSNSNDRDRSAGGGNGNGGNVPAQHQQHHYHESGPRVAPANNGEAAGLIEKPSTSNYAAQGNFARPASYRQAMNANAYHHQHGMNLPANAISHHADPHKRFRPESEPPGHNGSPFLYNPLHGNPNFNPTRPNSGNNTSNSGLVTKSSKSRGESKKNRKVSSFE